MQRENYTTLVQKALALVDEVMPWDLADIMENNHNLLLLDIREPYEFDEIRIEGALNVPRGILEAACDYDYEETEPELVAARDREIIVICRSGNRSVLAALTMQQMGYNNVKSLKTGMRGWSDYEQPMTNGDGMALSADDGDDIFNRPLRTEQKSPNLR